MDYLTYEQLDFIRTILIGSLITGVLMGAFPLTLGFTKKQRALGIGGFFACLIGAFVWGLFLSIPLCILFVVLIFRAEKKRKAAEEGIQ